MLANGLDDAKDVQAFADEVRQLSHGALVVRVKSEWRRGQVDFERGLIADVRAGKAELGWTGSRAFDRLGSTASTRSRRRFWSTRMSSSAGSLPGHQARGCSRGIRRLGIVDIGLLPGPLRHLATPRPIRRAGDLRGLWLLTQTPAEGDRGLSMLGATPSRQPAGAALRGLDGAEGHLASIAGNHYERAAPYVTADVVLWPRPVVLFAGPPRLGAPHRRPARRVAPSCAERAGRRVAGGA
jgi:TRAP-type C4-dicarboxylate transport system substrate-binding protein